MTLKEIQNKGEFDEVLEAAGENLVVMDFSAQWCGPCRVLGPHLERLAEEYKLEEVCKIDIEKNPELSEKYEISSIPRILLFKKGVVVGDVTGANVQAITEAIEKNI
jgi:thioredoxin 1